MKRSNGVEDRELQALGLSVSEIETIKLIQRKHGNEIYRIQLATGSYVLKRFPEGSEAKEIRIYKLFRQIGIPTLPVYGFTDRSILIEDLSSSKKWRMAIEDDVARAETGAALARWYKKLHGSGRRVIQNTPELVEFLDWQYDALDSATIQHTAECLGLTEPVWGLAAEKIEELKQAVKRLPQTICYNDFHWTNLALTREETNDLEAVVFDYHLVGIGIPYSDWRNVIGSLRPEAARRFIEAYGVVNDDQAILDAPLSILYSLSVAAKRPTLPAWALSLVLSVKDGTLERCLKRALKAIS